MTQQAPTSIGALVIGGGIVGMCVAGFLAEEGADVAILDDGLIGGSNANAGSLHVQMQSRFMRLYPEQVAGLEETLHLYSQSIAFWIELQTKLAADFEIKLSGGLMIAESAEQLAFLATKARRERELGLDVEILDRSALDTIAPYLGPSVVGAELCRNEGKLNPLACNAAVRRWITARGVVCLDACRAERIEREGSSYLVRTARGDIRAGRVVLAAASGTRALAAQLGLHVPASPEPLHMNITEATMPIISHLVQHAERPITLKQFSSGQIVIGGGWPAYLNGQRAHPMVRRESFSGNVSLAQHIVPRIAPLRVIRTWAGINTTVDGRGVLGAVEGEPGLFIAIPGDAGYTLGPLSARLVADSVLGRASGTDMSLFSPRRFGCAAA